MKVLEQEILFQSIYKENLNLVMIKGLPSGSMAIQIRKTVAQMCQGFSFITCITKIHLIDINVVVIEKFANLLDIFYIIYTNKYYTYKSGFDSRPKVRTDFEEICFRDRRGNVAQNLYHMGHHLTIIP